MEASILAGPAARVRPRPDLERVILHFDYDCFYAQVLEAREPGLRGRALGVRQKGIVVTCNYAARARGVGKLMAVSQAVAICPDLVLRDGEDLTPFRDASKLLCTRLASLVGHGSVERLGLDEVFIDVTELVDHNLFCLNRDSLAQSFFQLSLSDPELGFNCDLTSVAGCVQGPPRAVVDADNRLHLRLILGSHLAHYLRSRLEADFGYSSSCGIASSKLLSKLVGGRNKPRNQTTLLALEPDDAAFFVGDFSIRHIPGIGSKTSRLLESHILGHSTDDDDDHSHSLHSTLTARQVREHPSISPGLLHSLLAGPGLERGVGVRVWNLLHGVDSAGVKPARQFPAQISVEDTYRGLDTMALIVRELHKLACSLIRRMRSELVFSTPSHLPPDAPRWAARPKTVRLSIRSRLPTEGQGTGQDQTHHPSHRVSRSGPLPNFVFDLESGLEEVAQRLVAEALLPMLRRLRGNKDSCWNVQLLNICVTNIETGAAYTKLAAGRDISAMLKSQDESPCHWTCAPQLDNGQVGASAELAFDPPQLNEAAWDNDRLGQACPICGREVPEFAIAAHTKYHELGD